MLLLPLLLPPASCRRIAVTATLALHACALIGALALRPTPTPEVTLPQPIAVQWIEAPRIEPAKSAPVPSPPKSPPSPKRKAEPKPQELKAGQPQPKAAQPQPAQLAAADTPPAPEAPVVEAPPSPDVPATPAPSAGVSAPPVPPTDASAPNAPATPPTPAPAPPAPPSVTPPRFDAAYLNNPPPSYPQQARRRGEAGRVVLRVLVTASGRPERVELRSSSGSERLDGAALQAVQRWKFLPARQGDTPVSAWVLVPILFTLEG